MNSSCEKHRSSCRQELEAREISKGVKTNMNTTEKPKQPQFKLTPWSLALVTKGGTQPPSMPENQIKSVYCCGDHHSASCECVTDLQACFQILRKDCRCFVCLRSSHCATRTADIAKETIISQPSTKFCHLLQTRIRLPVTCKINVILTSQATESPQLPSTTTTANSETKGTVLL